MAAMERQLKSRDLKSHRGRLALKISYSLRRGDWRILRLDVPDMESPYLVYSGDPVSHAYAVLWGGTGPPEEAPAIQRWIVENAKGIPAELAACFAWYVTHR
jgi:hypothetical protein